MPSTAVRLEGITKRFGDVVAHERVDVTLERGTVLALLVGLVAVAMAFRAGVLTSASTRS